MKIYSVIQGDYEASVLHGQFLNLEVAEQVKERLESLWFKFLRDYVELDDYDGTEEEFMAWWENMENKYGRFKFYPYSLNEFDIVEDIIFETVEEYFNESE